MMPGPANRAAELLRKALRRMSGEEDRDGRGEKEKSSAPRRRNELGPRDIQFPVKEVPIHHLEQRLDWLRPSCVLQWMADPEDEEGCSDIQLEVWARGRVVHNKLMDLGQIFQVRINWGLATLRLNLVGIKDEIPISTLPSVLSCGKQKAFVIRLKDFHTYRLYGRGYMVEGPAMGARIIYLAAMDLDNHQAVELGDFAQWPVDLVMGLLDEHGPGETFRRPDAYEAGLITIKRTGSDEVVAEDQEYYDEGDDWMDGNDSESIDGGENLGQSPELNESCSRHPVQSPAAKKRSFSGEELGAVSRKVEEWQNAPPRHSTYKVWFGPGPRMSGTGSGGWVLSGDDWSDIEELAVNRTGTSGVSSEDRWSPRGELSGAKLLASSDEDMESPEEVMKRLLVEANIDEVDWANDSRRRSGSASSQSMIFSPILVKQGGDIVNVSSSSSAMNVSGGSGLRATEISSARATVGTTNSSNESAATMPLGSNNQQGSSGSQMQTAMAMWRLGWGSAACSTQFLTWANGDYYQAYVEDLNQVRRGAMGVVEEEETDGIEDEVFDMSQVE